ncbi:MAG: hypothetical protein K0R65_1510 [Crocinitomicaceae bacterium]|jgi:hypothetical protein|nr:hypothetical protein [Crocinitomicaceae bacterium]
MRTNYVLNPLFVLALAILLLNDFVLKSAFSNFLTGKLSDLAGVVVLALFLSAFFPKRKFGVYVFVILLFTFWKSPLSSSFIAFLNQQFSAGYSRVVDFTDIFCLLVLIPLYRFEPIKKQADLKWAFVPLSALTLFSVIATSRAQPEQYGYVYIGKEIKFETDKQNFLNVLTAHGVEYKMIHKYEYKGDSIENYELQKFLINSDTIYRAILSLQQPSARQLIVSVRSIHFTEVSWPHPDVTYANQDSVAEAYKTRTIHYFENLKPKN